MKSSVTYLWLVLLATGVAALGQEKGNVLGSSSFRPGSHNWMTAGQGTVAVVDSGTRHSIGNALRVSDQGPQMGQSTTPRILVKPGEIYYAEAWTRLDPNLRDRGLVDIEFFDDAHFLGAFEIGDVTEVEWKRVGAYFPVLEGATSMVLRFMPAATDGPAHGAGWIDDIVIRRVPEAETNVAVPTNPVLPQDKDNLVGQPPRDIRPTWFAHKPVVDFEDMTGWKYSVFPPARGEFMRSRSMPLAGQWTGRLKFSNANGNGMALLKPPRPAPIREPFDHVQVWVYGQRRNQGVSIVVVVRDAVNKHHRIGLGAVTWPYWSIADVPVHEQVPVPAALESIEIWNLRTPTEKPESIYLDNLAFYRQDTRPIKFSLPPPRGPFAVRLPVREDSVLPTSPPETTGHVTHEGTTYRFIITSPKDPLEYRYEPRTGTLSDLTCILSGRRFPPCVGGGVRVVLDGKEYSPGAVELQTTFLKADGQPSAPAFHFRVTDGRESTEISYRISIKGRSLIIDAQCDRGAGLNAGRPPQEVGFQPLTIPYLSYGYGGTPVMMHPEGLFASWLWDYYRSDASTLSNTASSYNLLTDGRRNPLHDRLIITFSRKLEEVLPDIPNPVATQAPKALGEIYCAVGTSGSDWEHPLAALPLWRQLKRYGVDHLICKQHAEIWSPDCGTGMVPFFQNPHASPAIPGGDKALAAYVHAVEALGYRYAFYTDYVLTTPVHEMWSEDDVARNSDGSWRRGWYQAFVLTPMRSWERAAHYAPLIARLGNNASYCDQHTSGPAWHKIDYDARKPLTGMFRPIIDAYAAVFQAERNAYHGPVFSEGDHHWMMAGLCDGSYAQFHPDDRPAYRSPFLLDFDLRKIHPLEMDLGMGWQGAYDLPPDGFDPSGAANDRLLCATIAFGHAGLLYEPWNAPSTFDSTNPMGRWKEILLRTYFMTQQAQLRYLMRPVSRIEYYNGQRFVDVSEAISSGAVNRSQVHVVYANGVEVWANGSFTENWEVTCGGQHVMLPPAGYAVYQSHRLCEHSSLVDGHRVDYAATPEYLFADARGIETELGPVRLSGGVVIKPMKHGIQVITVSPEQTITLRPSGMPFPFPSKTAVRIVWEDESGTRKEVSVGRLTKGHLILRFPDWAQQASIAGGHPE